MTNHQLLEITGENPTAARRRRQSSQATAARICTRNQLVGVMLLRGSPQRVLRQSEGCCYFAPATADWSTNTLHLSASSSFDFRVNQAM